MRKDLCVILKRSLSFRLIVMSAFLLMVGCAGKANREPGKTAADEAPDLPAGMVETSRLEGHTDGGGSGGNASVNKMSNRENTETASSLNGTSDVKSDVKSDKSANGVSDMSKTDNPPLKSKVSASDKSGLGDVQTLESTSITARGENPWSLEAQKVEYNDNTQRVRVKAIVWTLLDQNNKPRLTVRGQAADVNIETQNVAFEGPVEADGVNGEKLKVNHMVWDSAKQRILGSRGVRLVRSGTVMTGDNLSASPDLKQVEVSGHVRVTFAEREIGR